MSHSKFIKTLKEKTSEDNYEIVVEGPEDKEYAFRWILRHQQALELNGVIIDMQSASLICQYLDKLSIENKKNLLKREPWRIAELCWDIYSRVNPR
ncbi:MAG: hypothetical protein OEX12_08895 [Gammaproteobacteria bacterium]|nr:hypothetical protein [Gammaproteobacteria bacterium]